MAVFPIHQDSGGAFQALRTPLLCCEVLPPDRGRLETFLQSVRALQASGIELVFLPDAPQGKPRASSLLTAALLESRLGLLAIPHLNARDRNQTAICGLFHGAGLAALSGLKLVTGDPVPGGSVVGVYGLDSISMVSLLEEWNARSREANGPLLTPMVGHTLGELDPDLGLERLRAKVQAGARVVVTTPTLDPRELGRFLEDVQELPVQVIVGLVLLPGGEVLKYLLAGLKTLRIPPAVKEHLLAARSPEEGEIWGREALLEVVAEAWDKVRGFQLVPLFGKLDGLAALAAWLSGKLRGKEAP